MKENLANFNPSVLYSNLTPRPWIWLLSPIFCLSSESHQILFHARDQMLWNISGYSSICKGSTNFFVWQYIFSSLQMLHALTIHLFFFCRCPYRPYFWVLSLEVEPYSVLVIFQWLGLAGIFVFLVSFTFQSLYLQPCTNTQVWRWNHSFLTIALHMPLLLSPAGWNFS